MTFFASFTSPPNIKGTKILAYHSVNPYREDGIAIKPEQFDEQLQFLADLGLKGTSLNLLCREARNGNWPESKIAITFDDGYADNCRVALPILKKYGFSATVFIITGEIGTDNVHNTKWLEFDRVPKKEYRYMTCAELEEWKDAGMEIGAHTVSHPMLDELNYKDQLYEITKSKETLQEKMNIKVTSFCYPAGHYNTDTLKIIENAGFEQAVITPWELSQVKRENWFTLRRTGIYAHDTIKRFKFKISPIFDIARSGKHFINKFR